MGAQISVAITLTEINCGSCGGTYALNERYRAKRQEEGNGWHCPYCQCTWGYFGKTEAQQLREQLEAEKRRTEWAQNNAKAEREAREATERRLIARKAANTRLRNRVKNGVCPCCSRTFINLQQHMKSQHPDFQPDDASDSATAKQGQ